MGGQYPRQGSNQGGNSMSSIQQQQQQQQQNIMQNNEGHRAPLNVELGFMNGRRFIQDKIYEFLMQRQQNRDLAPKHVLSIVIRLEEGLFKSARTKVEYLSLETLENRLYVLIKRLINTKSGSEHGSNEGPHHDSESHHQEISSTLIKRKSAASSSARKGKKQKKLELNEKDKLLAKQLEEAFGKIVELEGELKAANDAVKKAEAAQREAERKAREMEQSLAELMDARS